MLRSIGMFKLLLRRIRTRTLPSRPISQLLKTKGGKISSRIILDSLESVYNKKSLFILLFAFKIKVLKI